MSDVSITVDRVLDLAEAVCDESASRSDFVELDSMVLADETSRRHYWDYCRMHIALEMEMRAHRALQKVHERGDLDSTTLAPWESDALLGAMPLNTPAPSSPVVTLLDTTFHGAAGYFSSGWPVAYLVAAVICGLGLLIGSLVHVSEPTQLARQSAPLPSSSPVVGQVTGMVDCQWADPQTEAFNGANVPLGRKYALTSGLMQIMYDSGARVILQGPCTYEVESPAGGFLSVGKLTARVEKGSGFRVQESEAANQKSEIRNQNLFAVRTPTATVTDLGTEFGVEVSKEGNTTSHVFRGSIRVQVAAADGKTEGTAQVLYENESARVEKDGNPQNQRVTLHRMAADPRAFVRRLVQPPKVIDLLDIVAGGDGSGDHRERGIDATTGDQASSNPAPNHGDTRQYHPVVWNKLIDGVFVPNGSAGPVQLDSAGHTFDGFPHTTGVTLGAIWSWAAMDTAGDRKDQGGGLEGHARRFIPHERGLLDMHPDKGITFSLEAVRSAYPGVRPVRFRAIVGLAHPDGLADIWVFIDGRRRFKRFQLCNSNGPVPINIDLKPSDRFLTLVSTRGESDSNYNWLAIGDPRLELVEMDPPRTKTENDLKRKEAAIP